MFTGRLRSKSAGSGSEKCAMGSWGPIQIMLSGLYIKSVAMCTYVIMVGHGFKNELSGAFKAPPLIMVLGLMNPRQRHKAECAARDGPALARWLSG